MSTKNDLPWTRDNYPHVEPARPPSEEDQIPESLAHVLELLQRQARASYLDGTYITDLDSIGPCVWHDEEDTALHVHICGEGQYLVQIRSEVHNTHIEGDHPEHHGQIRNEARVYGPWPLDASDAEIVSSYRTLVQEGDIAYVADYRWWVASDDNDEDQRARDRAAIEREIEWRLDEGDAPEGLTLDDLRPENADVEWYLDRDEWRPIVTWRPSKGAA